MPKTEVTVTIDEALAAELKVITRRLGVSRSRLFEDALRTWIRLAMRRELTKGYRAMAGDDSKTAEEDLPAGWEAIN